MTWQRGADTGSDVNFGIAYQSDSAVTFTWQYYDITNQNWVTIAADTPSNWVTFKAPHIGQYLIHVYGTSLDGVTKEYSIGWTVEQEVVTLSGMTWQKLTGVGSNVNFGVSYQANNAVTFTWQYYDIAKNEWHMIAENTGSNWITVDLPHIGQYLIYVEAKTSGGAVSKYSVGWTVEEESVKLNGFTWQKVSNDGANTNIGISYSSNTPVTFSWQYYDMAKNEWHMIAENTGSNWITAKLPHRGQYLIYVSAATKGGATATYSMGWVVSAKPTYFSQKDSRWAGMSFNGSTIGPSGCVPTSLAMILNGSYDMNLTPPNVAREIEKYTHSAVGASGKDIITTGNAYGRTVEHVSSQERAATLLQMGIPLIMLENVGIGHAVVVYGYDNGMVEVLDPFNRQFYNGWYALSSLWATPSNDSMDWDAGYPVFAIK